MPTAPDTPHTLDASTADWTQTFVRFSPTHLVTDALLLLCTVAIVIAGRRATRLGHERRFRLGWSFFVCATNVVQAVWFFLPQHFRADESFPLHLCDVLGLLAGVALLARHRTPRVLTVFCGLVFTTQAFVTPTLQFGPAFPRFWLFWLTHWQIVTTAIYILAVERYRPDWAGYRVAWVWMFGYFAVIAALDAVTGWNYGFLGQDQAGKVTIASALGPYPWRLVMIAVVASPALALVPLVAMCFPRAKPADA